VRAGNEQGRATKWVAIQEEGDMPGKIFYRERRKVDEGEKKPRYTLVAVADINLKLHVKHMRKQEMEQISEALGAELVELKVDDKGHKMQVGDD
jgi:hypothetical protein